MNEAVMRHAGAVPNAGVLYDFACAEGRAGVVIIGPPAKTHYILRAQQSAPAPNLNITMPCGTKKTYNAAVDLPDVTTACDCGDPTCWYVWRVYT